jgi:hypothetical protein
MVTLLQLLLIAILAPLSFHLARRTRHSRRWLPAFLLPLAAITLIILGHRSTTLSFLPPISWAIHPYVAPLLMAAAIPLMLTTLILRMPKTRARTAVAALTAVMLLYYVLFPILLPLAARPSLAAIPTRFDRQQTCLQTHTYTCGPASAVTCLRALHIDATESALAIAANAAPALGTDPILLADAINHLAAPHHLHCNYRLIQTLDRLTTPAIANLFNPHYGGHYVAVLQVTPDYVLVGDPLNGTAKWSHEDFLHEWTGAAHVFTPVPSTPILPSCPTPLLSSSPSAPTPASR